MFFNCLYLFEIMMLLFFQSSEYGSVLICLLYFFKNALLEVKIENLRLYYFFRENRQGIK
jgi:hypothetical protein